MSGAAPPSEMRPTRVVVCGGGVAAIESLLALREHLDIRPHVTLVAPNRSFVYQPLAVAEPFGLARTHRFELSAVARDLGAELRVGSVLRVSPAHRCVVLTDGSTVSYDAAILAVGARRRPWLAGAIPFGGADDTAGIADLVGRLERGTISRVAFTAPPGLSWTLPLYELALLTASRLAERGVGEVELSVVTPEQEPLGIFGNAAARMLRGTLADRGVRLRSHTEVEGLLDGRLELSGGRSLEVDEVVALARLKGPRLPGVPADAEGFILVDEHCRVAGEPNLYAAGDGAAFGLKQGGLAAQQADAAAEAVAADLGAALDPEPFEPMLRAMLLTGVAPIYLRSAPNAAQTAEIAGNALWWPPTKIAGRYLGPYLACMGVPSGVGGLDEALPGIAAGAGTMPAGQGDPRELALRFAEADARGGDFRSALRWLEAIERLDGKLPTGFAERRESWLTRAR